MKNQDYILKTKNLSIGYNLKKPIVVLSNINIDINKAKFITLIGKNGIGKSTLLRTLSGIQEPLNGTVYIKEKNLKNYHNEDLSKQISIVLTEKIPPSHLTVYEVVALSRQIYTNWIGKLNQKDYQQIEKALKLCGILNLKNKNIDELSDGQFQKVMIARAIAQDTSIIILDEPTAHLDIINKVEIFNLLKKIALSENKLIICSSHEIQLCINYASDIWLITEGELISDSKKNIFQNNLLSKIFNSDLIEFDSKTKQFIYK
jgi:iron complex transport system ATP-binding protein